MYFEYKVKTVKHNKLWTELILLVRTAAIEQNSVEIFSVSMLRKHMASNIGGEFSKAKAGSTFHSHRSQNHQLIIDYPCHLKTFQYSKYFYEMANWSTIRMYDRQ